MEGKIMLSQAKTRDAYLEFLKIVKSSRPDYLLEVLDFLDVWKLFKEDAKEIYHQIFPAPSVSKYPRTNELGFIDFFIERLKELLNNSKSLVSMEDQTETFQRNLISLREDYRKFQGHHNDEEIKHLIEEFKDVSYQAEYLIDSYFDVKLVLLLVIIPWDYLVYKKKVKFTRRRLEQHEIGLRNEKISVNLLKSSMEDKERENKDEPTDDLHVRAWNDLKESFPNDNNGSRIMFTSRISDESWELLQVKLFNGKDYPPVLREVGKKIAANCRGLPLAIVLASGLLKNREREEECWKQVMESSMSLVADEPQRQWMGILELSYKHFPDYLKTCFLYLGAFPEDAEISVSKLVCLWIAEGLIRKRSTEENTLEDEAEDHLKSLIDRNLVMISRKKSKGGANSCKTHDLREFCLAKLKEENFLQLINVCDELPTAGHIQSIQYRLCIYLKGRPFDLSRLHAPYARSLLLFNSKNRLYKILFEYFFESRQSNLLRVLDFRNIILETFPSIDSLVLLRYLNIQIATSKISCNLRNLQYLETLSVRIFMAGLALLSTEEFSNMSRLRHLKIDKHILWQSLHRVQLVNLETISGMYVSCVCESEEILKSLPTLQKLSCIFRGSGNHAMKNEMFPYLGFLNQLESLKVFYEGKVPYPHLLNFPSQLRKLTLSEFRQPWREVSAIAELPNLDVLKLQNEAFVGEEWDTKEGVFLKLKYLKLESMKLVKWIASEENFPLLEKVVFVNCRLLEEIPSGIGDIPTLDLIEIKWCGQTAIDSVLEIQRAQEDQGNEHLKVSILNG
ncbi:hypothetical protein M9H77_09135 [Catharanthus roseus]|uniref:Uncharacterized protein n=1 Tax=Catharanthus roseus TaxID=4058 RepID=A0ACC0BZS8_CATRO|nr:hypothetical protein M9H77_09135 [Catharanthus roseus]